MMAAADLCTVRRGGRALSCPQVATVTLTSPACPGRTSSVGYGDVERAPGLSGSGLRLVGDTLISVQLPWS